MRLHVSRSLSWMLFPLALAGCQLDEAAPPEVEAASAAVIGCDVDNNYLRNPLFTAYDPPSTLVTTPDYPVRSVPSAAGSWYAHNGEAGTTTVAVIDYHDGSGINALHVTTTGANSGVLQQFMPPDTGLIAGFGITSIEVLSGDVGLVLGAVGAGGTGDTVRSPSSPYDFYYTTNATWPANQFGILSIGGPADFIVHWPQVDACNDARVAAVSAPTVDAKPGRSCSGELHILGTIDVVDTGEGAVLWRMVDADGTALAGGRLVTSGSGSYPIDAWVDVADVRTVQILTIEPNHVVGAPADGFECAAPEGGGKG